ncbi:putative Alpha/beta-Hydrolases superfamily protein [Quillaja saponaria]|uniref:Alpha/beta-Hydrolases superfamily protein n=1 Tax=Quillaja saponaria TaxID=32244 RepID=A0AAD7VKU2_QUISA|nr:putative Alpha/beta-Hydrolases superfamily protein [Quillaja saponaria]
MSLTFNYTNTHLHRLEFSPSKPFQTREFRIYKRRRLKSNRKLSLRNQFGVLFQNPFENLFHSLISQYPSVNSLEFIAPALGFASGVTLYLSRLTSRKNSGVLDIGEWVLFTSPTPFNRFVLLRCPSISFQGSELLEDVNKKLVKEERHYVKLSRGRIEVKDDDGEESVLEAEKLTYQRVCITTEDGGVVSLDWPANLDLEEEHGLDTTLFLVPGTPQGSMDKDIRSFVLEALKWGLFPVVMNPRGCAGSPLTTARLFTAADSDDISTAIQYINKARPWTTFMGVGWGYGANMLTKYLSEVGECTPLTAATCIDNPFDLEEATRSSPHHIVVDHKLTGGLIDILRANKELFQGKTKGFDVEKALLANSVRDFEKSISMKSYGFGAIEDFYSKCSTRDVTGNVKIPVLFIQSDDGAVPLISIPRSSIAENPFTSLLLCSCVPSSVIASCRVAMSWCQHLTIEWLAAVELGLLKGRHPLLKDVDVTINPLKGLAIVEDVKLKRASKDSKFLDLTQSSANNGCSVHPTMDMLEASDAASSFHFRSRRGTERNFDLGDRSMGVENRASQGTSSIDPRLVEEENVSSEDTNSERGQVLQTAEVVMNMLDTTMPGALIEEEKKKVLTAVYQGETLMNALQDAVPEDVRGKLTNSVTGILQAKGINLKFDALLGVSQVPNASSGVEGLSQDHRSLNQKKRIDIADVSDKPHVGMSETAEQIESELQPLEKSRDSVNVGLTQSATSDELASSGSPKKGTDESTNNIVKHSKGKATPYLDKCEKELQMGAKSNQPEVAGSSGEAFVGELKNQIGEISQLDTKEEDNAQKIEEKKENSTSEESKMTSTGTKEEPPSSNVSSSEAQTIEQEGNTNQKRDSKNMQNVPDQAKSIPSDSNSPAFNVSEALDALTGMDDSTKVAVNSVFGVIEDMISQLEESSDTDAVKDRKDTERELENKEENMNPQSIEPNSSFHPPVYNNLNSTYSQHDVGNVEEEPTQSHGSTNPTSMADSCRGNAQDHVAEKESKKDQLIANRLVDDNLNRLRHVNIIPLYKASSSYKNSLHEYSDKHLENMPSKSLDLDTTTTLFLDYFPEEGQWKLLEQPRRIENISGTTTTCEDADCKVNTHLPVKANDTDKIVQHPYEILDTEKQPEHVTEYTTIDNMNEDIEIDDDRELLMQYVKHTVLDSLNIEVGRRLKAEDMKEMKSKLARDLEHVVNSISLAVVHNKEHRLHVDGKLNNIDGTSGKVGSIQGEHIIRAISSSVQETRYLRRVLPIGVIVGSSLAALRKSFNVMTMQGNVQRISLTPDEELGKKYYDKVSVKGTDQIPDQKTSLDGSVSTEGIKTESKNMNNNTVMVGAVTAALGASAILVEQQDPYRSSGMADSSSMSFKVKENHQKEPDKLEEVVSEKDQSNIVTSLAEKAMSVAGPVVPKKDGEVDQERLVAMLAELGQKGGLMRLVGKVALLWGGLRGAVSLTDRLILFLRIAERPLLQRIFGFISMVLVLWSPVAIPLLPTLVQNWTTGTTSTISELACIVGLYVAVMILVMLWGKRIRGYEDALEQYGLDLMSFPKMHDFLKGLVGGIMLVLSIHSINMLLGCASFSRPPTPSSSDAIMWLKVYGKMLMLVGQGIAVATAIALVEELLFRSWLPEEIAVDLGYHKGIVISGVAFSLLQRSPQAIPALWLLSLALAGARQRSGGSLSSPIGLRAGILASSFILKRCGFLMYNTTLPLWMTGTHPFQPI